MTANPARPVSGTPIASPWGQAVADTVTRRYQDAAARDADLGAHTPADLLGQTVYLNSPAGLYTYHGAAAGWTRPWNLGWGLLGFASGNKNADSIDGNTGILVGEVQVTALAGRRIQVFAAGPFFGPEGAWMDIDTTPELVTSPSYDRQNIPKPAGGINDVKGNAPRYQQSFVFTNQITGTGKFQWLFGGPVGVHLSDERQWSVAVLDVGPAVQPTSLELDANGVARVTAEAMAALNIAEPPPRDLTGVVV